MTFYYKKSVQKPTEKDNIWTPKHNEFCLENRLPPVAKLLWQWLLEQGKLSDECEPDLAEFNGWVAKHRGKGYCRLHLKNALQQLINLRVVHLVKRFTWRLVRLVTRSIEDLFPKKKLRSENESYDPAPSKPQSSEGGTRQQQQSFPIQDNVGALRDAGLEFDNNDTEVVNRPNNEIKLALAIFQLRGGFEKIKENPEGWLRTCLRERYWEEDRNFKALSKKLGNLEIWSELFPDTKPDTSDDGFGFLLDALINLGLDINSTKKALPST